jgi:hypothetical protein
VNQCPVERPPRAATLTRVANHTCGEVTHVLAAEQRLAPERKGLKASALAERTLAVARKTPARISGGTPPAGATAKEV